MKDKLIEVLKKIVETPDLIEDICRNNSEYYFRFGDYYFSLLRRSSTQGDHGKYTFYLYPEHEGDTSSLVNEFVYGPGETELVFVDEKESPPETHKYFEMLTDILKTKHLNLDSIFDAILGRNKT
jgi:hypothetical protein